VALLLTVAPACGGGDEEPTPAVTPTPGVTPTQGGTGYLPEISRISVEEVKAKLDAGANIVIVDTRSREAYEVSHITGAISIPERELAQHSSELSRYDEIITYCT
jgi:hypothetical protein